MNRRVECVYDAVPIGDCVQEVVFEWNVAPNGRSLCGGGGSPICSRLRWVC